MGLSLDDRLNRLAHEICAGASQELRYGRTRTNITLGLRPGLFKSDGDILYELGIFGLGLGVFGLGLG